MEINVIDGLRLPIVKFMNFMEVVVDISVVIVGLILLAIIIYTIKEALNKTY